MRNITKGHEPPSLTAWRATNPIDYNGYPDKDGLRASLEAEQRGLCCYCQSRIRAEIGSMKIEHWASHSGHPTLRLVYSNLLGSCMGGEGKPGREQHCDTYKGEQDLCRNPSDPSHDVEAVLHYLNDGRITSPNQLFDEQLNSVLNLNHPVLMNQRKQVLDSLKKLLGMRGGTLKRGDWEKILEDWTGAHDRDVMRPYSGVIVYWVRKKLARA
jgi:uncharacterized protein (TIGR02646 family)